jgi:glycerol-3-phosphate acyltransferase PlsY
VGLYPVWFDFKGGKGRGGHQRLTPAHPAGTRWCLVLTATGFVGLATMLAAAVLPVWVALTELPMQRELFWFLVALALFIIYTHRGNIQRLREGRENRLEKAMLWRRPR